LSTHAFLSCFLTANCPLLTARYHFMTRSARASTLGGIVRTICFAALRLMMNSKALFAAQHRRKNR
jgi:hypothetical protein